MKGGLPPNFPGPVRQHQNSLEAVCAPVPFIPPGLPPPLAVGPPSFSNPANALVGPKGGRRLRRIPQALVPRVIPLERGVLQYGGQRARRPHQAPHFADPFGRLPCYPIGPKGQYEMLRGQARVEEIDSDSETIIGGGNELFSSEILDFWSELKGHTIPPDHDDLTILRSKDLKPARKTHALSAPEALKVAMDSIKKAKELKEEDFKYSLPVKTLRDLPFALFNEIDAYLFGGVLRGNVYLKWTGKLHALLGWTKRPARSGNRIGIALALQLLNAEPLDILEVLLHQMAHAFLLQCCEPKDDDVGYRHPLKHDAAFSGLMCVIQLGLKMDPRGYPSVIGCMATSPSEDQRNPQILKRSVCSQEDRGKMVPQILAALEGVKQSTETPKLKLDKGCAKDTNGRLLPTSHWLHDKPGSKKPVLRIVYSKETTDYVELQYKDRAYPIPKKKCPETTPSKMELDDTIADDKMFRLIFDYLNSGSWEPSPPPYSTGLPLHPSPRIAPVTPAETPYFLTQLRAYRAALMLNLPKMRELALNQMEKSARVQCVEDPIVLLEMLYHGTSSLGAAEPSADEAPKDKKDKGGEKGAPSSFPPPPDRDLRTWAKAFLRASTDDKKMPNNIDILRRGDQYKDRWVQLRLKGSCLLEDADKIEAELFEEREKKTKKKEQEAEDEQKEASLKAMTNALQHMSPGVPNPGVIVNALPPPVIGPPFYNAAMQPGFGGGPMIACPGIGQPGEQKDELERKREFFETKWRDWMLDNQIEQLREVKEQLAKEKEELDEARQNLLRAQIGDPLGGIMPGGVFWGNE